MKRVFITVLSLILFMCVSYTPVFASDTTPISIPDYSYQAYDFFVRSGFSEVIDRYNLEYSSSDVTSYASLVGSSSVVDITAQYRIFGDQVLPSGNEYTQDRGSFNFSGNVPSTGKIITSENMTIILPRLKGKYDNSLTIYLEKGKSYLLGFYASYDYWSFLRSIPTSSGSVFSDFGSDISGKLGKYVYKLDYKGNTGSYNLNFPDVIAELIPIYFGKLDTAPSGALSAMGLPTKLEQILSNGDNTTSSLSSFVSDYSYTIDDVGEQQYSIEQNFSNSLDSNLKNFNTSPELLSNGNFLKSMKFVSDMYTRFVVNTPFEFVLTFCLILGICLTMIGKLRNR